MFLRDTTIEFIDVDTFQPIFQVKIKIIYWASIIGNSCYLPHLYADWSSRKRQINGKVYREERRRHGPITSALFFLIYKVEISLIIQVWSMSAQSQGMNAFPVIFFINKEHTLLVRSTLVIYTLHAQYSRGCLCSSY